jgi:hypothetical protein
LLHFNRRITGIPGDIPAIFAIDRYLDFEGHL